MAATRVLLVDDSAFARKVLRDVLSAEPDLAVVGAARDGLDALEKIGELTPDVVTLDLNMPHLDGLGVLRALAGRPAPRVVVVSVAEADSVRGLAALELGAVELVHKPTPLATGRLYELGGALVAAVRAAHLARTPPATPWGDAPAALTEVGAARRRIVVIGASTGGPQAVARVLHELPAELPCPVAVVLHLPVGYTGPYAARLAGECRLRVREAEDGMVLEPGLAVIARAGRHLVVADEGGRLVARLAVAPAGVLHRPSADVLFSSAAAAAGARVLGAVLTGMGDDGLAGARAIHAAAGDVITEAESTSVIYGMPRVVHEAGVDVAQVRIEEMAREIVRRV